MSKYDKTAAIAKDLIELCKKHNVSLLHAPGMIKKRGTASQIVKQHSLMNFFVLDCSKDVVDGEIKVIEKKKKQKEFKRQNLLGKDIKFPNSVVLKISKNRKND